MPEYYLIAALDPDIREIVRLMRLLAKRGISIENVVITVRIDGDSSSLGLLGGLKKNYPIIVFKGLLPVPVAKKTRI